MSTGAPSDARATPHRRTGVVITLAVVLLGVVAFVLYPRGHTIGLTAHIPVPQSDLTNAAITARTVYNATGSFRTTGELLSALRRADPRLGFTTERAPLMIDTVSVARLSAGVVVFSEPGAGTACWIVSDNFTTAAFTVSPTHVLDPGEWVGWARTPSCEADRVAGIPRTPTGLAGGTATWQPNFRTLGETTGT